MNEDVQDEKEDDSDNEDDNSKAIMTSQNLTKDQKLRAIFGKKRPGDDVFDQKAE